MGLLASEYDCEQPGAEDYQTEIEGKDEDFIQ